MLSRAGGRLRDFTMLTILHSNHDRYPTAWHPDKGDPGFVRLTYKGKPLDDDSVLISQLDYGDYGADSWFQAYINVEALDMKTYTIQCHELVSSKTFHDAATIMRLKVELPADFSVPYSTISVVLDDPEQDDMTLLSSLGSQTIRVRIDGHCRVTGSLGGETNDLFSHQLERSSTLFRFRKSE
jgi:hypothetical protein